MDNVELRNVIDADLPIFFEQQNDPEATQLAAFPAREREAFMTHWRHIMKNPDGRLKTILFNGEVAGNIVGFEQGGKRLVGYWLGRECWGKGIATKALAQFLDFETVRPLYAYVAKHNVGSRRVLEKCGFTVAGEDRYLADSGEVIEEFLMVLP